MKTSFSRPPSKPRVRNPLTSLKNQGQGISPPLSGAGCPIPNIGSSHRSTESPTRLERDFLASGGGGGGAAGTPPTATGWGEASFDEYFNIPEDTALLNSSLSSSLASLFPHGKDLESSLATPDVS